MQNKKNFNYSYSCDEKKELEAILKKYEPKHSEESKMDQIKKLDKSVTHSGMVISVTLGIIGALLLGTGMSFSLVWKDSLFWAGVVLGITGLIVCATAYPVYNKVTEKRRKEVAEKIIKLANEIL